MVIKNKNNVIDHSEAAAGRVPRSTSIVEGGAGNRRARSEKRVTINERPQHVEMDIHTQRIHQIRANQPTEVSSDDDETCASPEVRIQIGSNNNNNVGSARPIAPPSKKWSQHKHNGNLGIKIAKEPTPLTQKQIQQIKAKKTRPWNMNMRSKLDNRPADPDNLNAFQYVFSFMMCKAEETKNKVSLFDNRCEHIDDIFDIQSVIYLKG
jgi:hypothetical protein